MNTWIVPAQLLEPISIDGKKTTSMSGCIIRLAVVISTFLFLGRHGSFFVQHAPLKKAPRMTVTGVDGVDGEVIPLNAIYHRNTQRSPERSVLLLLL